MRLYSKAFALALVGAWVAGCGHPSRVAERAPSSSANGSRQTAAGPVADAAYRIGRSEAVLVDVREREEVEHGMAAPAIWMPTSRIRDGDPAWEGFVGSLAKDKPVFLYCESGGRSEWAAELLRARGFQATNLGGLSDWARAGQPVRTPERLEIGR